MGRRKDLKTKVDRGMGGYGYEHPLIQKLINDFMLHGRKHTAEKLVFDAINKAKQTLEVSGKELFDKVVENLLLTKETRKHRYGGTNHDVPKLVSIQRAEKQTMKLLRNVVRDNRSVESTSSLLGQVLIDSFSQTGLAVKQKEQKKKNIDENMVYAFFYPDAENVNNKKNIKTETKEANVDETENNTITQNEKEKEEVLLENKEI